MRYAIQYGSDKVKYEISEMPSLNKFPQPIVINLVTKVERIKLKIKRDVINENCENVFHFNDTNIPITIIKPEINKLKLL